jgi:hypothetical protein
LTGRGNKYSLNLEGNTEEEEDLPNNEGVEL